jgi:hypothetical protein
MTTTASSTARPVGATPGSIASMTRSCVKQSKCSSTRRSVPTVRETDTARQSAGIWPINCSR